MRLHSLTCGLTAALALAACQPVPSGAIKPLPPASAEARALMPLDSRWDVVMLNGRALEPGRATVSISGPNPNLAGSNGVAYGACNSFSGAPFAPLGLPGDPVGPITTLIGCPPEAQALDDALGAALAAARTIATGAQTGTVDLIADGQGVMTLRRQ